MLSKDQVQTVKVYSKYPCVYCEKAKALLKNKGFEYELVDLYDTDRIEGFRKMYPTLKSVPQVFINGLLIGGYDRLNDLINGKLTLEHFYAIEPAEDFDFTETD